MIKIKDYLIFKAEVAKVKRLNGITNADIAKMTGYSTSAIDKFLAENITGRNDSDKVAQAIAEKLKIEL